MADPFQDKRINDLFGSLTGKKKEEIGIPWHAKVIDGKYYVPLEQVEELLRQNDVLPKVREGIKRRVEKGPPV